MTADVFSEDRERCMQAGMNDQVNKPVEAERLYDALLRWLQVPQPAMTEGVSAGTKGQHVTENSPH